MSNKDLYWRWKTPWWNHHGVKTLFGMLVVSVVILVVIAQFAK